MKNHHIFFIHVLHICQLQFYYINTYFSPFFPSISFSSSNFFFPSFFFRWFCWTIIFVGNIHSSIHCSTFTLNNANTKGDAFLFCIQFMNATMNVCSFEWWCSGVCYAFRKLYVECIFCSEIYTKNHCEMNKLKECIEKRIKCKKQDDDEEEENEKATSRNSNAKIAINNWRVVSVSCMYIGDIFQWCNKNKIKIPKNHSAQPQHV